MSYQVQRIKSLDHYIDRSSHQSCSIKKVFLEISQNSQENTCARASFLIKLHRCFPVNFAKFLRTAFLQNPDDCFWIEEKEPINFWWGLYLKFAKIHENHVSARWWIFCFYFRNGAHKLHQIHQNKLSSVPTGR